MKRRLWLARVAFHDWMWKGGMKPRGPLRRLARLLPLYFSDPHALSEKRIRAAFANYHEIHDDFPLSDQRKVARRNAFREAATTHTLGSGVNVTYVYDRRDR